MSNYCTNVLRLVGEPQDVQRFIVENCDIIALDPSAQRLTFRALIPIGPQENAKPHWGVRSDALDVSAWDVAPWRETQLEASCNFYTSWNPPQIWFEAVARRYPTLLVELTYEESGNALAGQLRAEHGDVSEFLYEEELFEEED